MAIKQPKFGEIAKQLPRGAKIPGYNDTLAANSDSVLRKKGGHLGIYTELLRDDQVSSCFQQRRRAVVAKRWEVEPASESAADKAAAEFIREQLQRVEWDKVTDKMLYAVHYGYSIAELMYARDGRFVTLDRIIVRDRARFRFGEKAGDLYMVRRTGTLELMPPAKFWTVTFGAEHDEMPYGLGLGHQLYWPVWFKRNGIKFWMSFLDKYGAPTAVGKAPIAQLKDAEFKRIALEAIEAIHSDSAVLLPSEAELELLETFRKGGADFDQLRDAMDRAISKVILSQTMTTDDGSSLAQAKVHEDVRDDIVAGDSDLICESANRSWVKWLTEWNFPGAKPPRIWRDVEPEEDLNSRAERDQKVYALGYEPTEEYIREVYGEGWVKREQNVQRIPGLDDFGPAFAELTALTADRNTNRENQQALAEAARAFANRYQGVLGQRVAELLQFLDDSQDLATFAKQLNELARQAPPDEVVDKLHRGGFVARLMGLLRGARAE